PLRPYWVGGSVSSPDTPCWTPPQWRRHCSRWGLPLGAGLTIGRCRVCSGLSAPPLPDAAPPLELEAPATPSAAPSRSIRSIRLPDAAQRGWARLRARPCQILSCHSDEGVDSSGGLVSPPRGIDEHWRSPARRRCRLLSPDWRSHCHQLLQRPKRSPENAADRDHACPAVSRAVRAGGVIGSGTRPDIGRLCVRVRGRPKASHVTRTNSPAVPSARSADTLQRLGGGRCDGRRRAVVVTGRSIGGVDRTPPRLDSRAVSSLRGKASLAPARRRAMCGPR